MPTALLAFRLATTAPDKVARNGGQAEEALLHFFYTAGRYELVGGGTD